MSFSWIIAIGSLVLLTTIYLVVIRSERSETDRRLPKGRLYGLPPGAERRRAPRIQATVLVQYRVLSGGVAGQAKTQDISRGGLRLLVDERLYPGTELELKLHFLEVPQPVVATGRIVWMREIPQVVDQTPVRWFANGVQLTAVPPEIQGILDRLSRTEIITPTRHPKQP